MNSKHMRPRLVSNDTTNVGLVNSVLFSKNGLCHSARGVSPTNIPNLFWSQFGRSALFTTRTQLRKNVRQKNAATLAPHVVQVVCAGSEEKVRGILARWIVATVKCAQTRGNGTIGDGPGNALASETHSIEPEITITHSGFARTPRPTLIESPDAHFAPESENVLRGQRRDATLFLSHDRLLTRRSWSGRLTAKSGSRPLLHRDVIRKVSLCQGNYSRLAAFGPN